MNENIISLDELLRESEELFRQKIFQYKEKLKFEVHSLKTSFVLKDLPMIRHQIMLGYIRN